jgi:sensor histidine kinase YesM
LRDLTIPTLLLQPLVENSIKHGLEPQVEGGSITVRASRDAALQRLTLTVDDTGVGMAANAANTNANAHPAPDSGFGLAQVRERLRTLYGREATLSMGPGLAGGAHVIIHIPLSSIP